MASQKAKDFSHKIIMTMAHCTRKELMGLAFEEQEFLKAAPPEDRDYYANSGAGEGLYMIISGLLLTEPELALLVPGLDVSRYD